MRDSVYEELREAKLEHMERKFSKPKNADDAFWRGEEEAFDSLVFPLGVVRGAIEGNETPGAVRGARDMGGNRDSCGPWRA